VFTILVSSLTIKKIKRSLLSINPYLAYSYLILNKSGIGLILTGISDSINPFYSARAGCYFFYRICWYVCARTRL